MRRHFPVPLKIWSTAAICTTPLVNKMVDVCWILQMMIGLIYINTTNSPKQLRQPRSSMAPWSVRLGVRSRKLSNVVQSSNGWPKVYYLELLHASKGTLSRKLHLQSLAPTNPHWARVVGYGPFSLCVIHKQALCPSSGGINRLMIMSWDISNIPPRHPHFTKMTWLYNTEAVTGGKSIAVWTQSISGAANVTYYDIHGRKGEVLFFCSVDTTRNWYLVLIK
jgi:hypothetical protein